MDPYGRVARWTYELQQFNFEPEHVPGVKLDYTDALSRIHDVNALEVDL